MWTKYHQWWWLCKINWHQASLWRRMTTLAVLGGYLWAWVSGIILIWSGVSGHCRTIAENIAMVGLGVCMLILINIPFRLLLPMQGGYAHNGIVNMFIKCMASYSNRIFRFLSETREMETRLTRFHMHQDVHSLTLEDIHFCCQYDQELRSLWDKVAILTDANHPDHVSLWIECGCPDVHDINVMRSVILTLREPATESIYHEITLHQ